MLLNRSRGELGGKPFAQHCSCPACFRCSVGSTMAAFLGTIFVCEVLPQSHRDKPCAQSARRQRPCCCHLRRCISPSKMNVPLTQVALVARPCAPAAQLTDDSSSSSRRLAISLCPLRGHLILSKTAPYVCLLQHENASMKSFGQIDSSRIKMHLPKLRSDSFQKFATASQTLGFEKAVFAPN